MNGILLVDKERGMTSHDVIAQIKRNLAVEKIGHAGTLDPNATGLLVVLINDATKLSNYLLEDVKEYLGEVVLGASTTTEDVDGEIVNLQKVERVPDVDDVLSSFIGKQQQIPPMYSAIKTDGKKLYQLARKGIEVERAAREIEIFDLKKTSEIEYFDQFAKFEIYARVSKGTYIRTLCVDIGKRLGYYAHMGALKRIASGSLRIENAYSLEMIKANNFQLISMIDALKKYHVIEVDHLLAKKIKNGMKLDLNEIDNKDSKEDIVVFSYQEELIGIYRKEEGKYRVERVWN